MRKHEIPIVADVMQREHETVPPDMTLEDLVAFFLKRELTCVPVVDQGRGDLLLGFVSEGDALEHLANKLFEGVYAAHQTVGTIMKQHPMAVTPQTDVFAVASVFIARSDHYLPVVDDEHRLQGLISRHRILAVLHEYDNQMMRDWLHEHFPPDLRLITNLRFIASRP